MLCACGSYVCLFWASDHVPYIPSALRVSVGVIAIGFGRCSLLESHRRLHGVLGRLQGHITSMQSVTRHDLGGEVVVRHRERSITLDLHCADTLRYPLLSFPRSAVPVSAKHPSPRPGADGDTIAIDSAIGPQTTKEVHHEHTPEELNFNSDLEFWLARERGCDLDHAHTPDELNFTSDPESQGKRKLGQGEGAFEGNNGCRDRSRIVPATSSTHGNSSGGDDTAAHGASGSTTPRQSNTSKGEPTTNPRRPQQGQLTPALQGEPPTNHHRRFQQDQPIPSLKGESTTNHQRHPQQDHQLIPARLVSVLVDGAGKGWIAAKRLWSVREVGIEALAEAGLGFTDVDREQEFFVGTALEYLPLSLLRDTCTVAVSRKDDVHSKQRLGEIPKHFRYVSHGIDSDTGVVLLGSELKNREEQLLQGG